MPDCEPIGDCVRQFAIFDHENKAAGHPAGGFRELGELFVRLAADRALRAMLENENGIGFGPLQKLFKIVFLS